MDRSKTTGWNLLMKLFFRGMRSGIPIGLGYLSVSFTFGIMAVSMGFSPWQALIISMLTVTSAGQLAGIETMTVPGQYLTMLISQCTINLRYAFMSVSLSQKVTEKFSGIKRWLLAFFITDEIFAVASSEDSVDPAFFLGLSVIPYVGWAGGTLIGALLGNVLPAMVMDALCIAIYGMFLAIVVPPARKSKAVRTVVLLAVAIHCALTYLPILSKIPSGISISISAILAALAGAFFFPLPEDEREVDEK